MIETPIPCATTAAVASPDRERREYPRAKVSLPVRVRPSDPKEGAFEDVRVTLDASRKALYFTTQMEQYSSGMRVRVTFPYRSDGGSSDCEVSGEVRWVVRLADGHLGVAVLLPKPVNRTACTGGVKAARKAGPENADRRTAVRYPFTASAEVIELRSGARLQARTSDLGLEGCYIDTFHQFPEGTSVRLRMSKGSEVLDTQARVSYCHPGLGLGLAFGELTSDQVAVVVDWLVNSRTQLEPAVQGPPPTERLGQPAQPDHTKLLSLINLLVRKRILTESEGAALLRDPIL